MSTTPEDRRILREWRDTHTNIRPAREDERCVHSVWVAGRWAGHCGQPAEWLINYGERVLALGVRAHCEAHTVAVIRKWAAFERGEVPA